MLWRLAPALWLEWAIRRLISWAIALLENEDERAWLDEQPRNSHWFGGWLAVIEARLDELIDLRAHQLLNWRWDPRDVPSHHPAPAVRSFDDCLIRLVRLIQRFEDVHRLALRRAERLQRFARELEANPLKLVDPADSTDPTDSTAAAAAFFVAHVSVCSHRSGLPIRAPP